MSERQVKAWVCDLCGHIWIAGKGGAPEKCAKCRKRGWNKTAAKPSHKTAPRPAPRPRIAAPVSAAGYPVDYKARAAGMTDLAVGEGDICSVPVRTGVEGFKVVEVKVDDVLVPLVPPGSEGNDERFAVAVDRLVKPHPKVGEKCPHGWSSWFLCAKCNGKAVPA